MILTAYLLINCKEMLRSQHERMRNNIIYSERIFQKRLYPKNSEEKTIEMGLFQYRLAEETVFVENEFYRTYGMIVKQGKIIVAHIRDICCCKKDLQALIDCCNDLQPAPEHLKDVVEDFLAEW